MRDVKEYYRPASDSLNGDTNLVQKNSVSEANHESSGQQVDIGILCLYILACKKANHKTLTLI